MKNIIVEKSFELAKAAVATSKILYSKKEFVFMDQLKRSGTSVGAMVEEAQEAESRRDFTHKMAIALKECRETRYWIRLMRATKTLTENETKEIMSLVESCYAILISIVRSSRA